MGQREGRVMRDYTHWIAGGEFSFASIARRCAVSGIILNHVAQGASHHIAAALAAAHYAAREFLAVECRAAWLKPWAALMEREQARLARIEMRETGVCYSMAQAEMSRTALLINQAACKIIDMDAPGVWALVLDETCTLSVAMAAILAGLTAGRAIVVAMTDAVPCTLLEAARLTTEAAFPDGWLNIVTGVTTKAIRALQNNQVFNRYDRQSRVIRFQPFLVGST